MAVLLLFGAARMAGAGKCLTFPIVAKTDALEKPFFPIFRPEAAAAFPCFSNLRDSAHIFSPFYIIPNDLSKILLTFNIR